MNHIFLREGYEGGIHGYKKEVVQLKKTLMITVVLAVFAILCGCGGGGGGGVSPSISATPGHGNAAFELHFNSRTADRDDGTAATGTINIIVTVTGYYAEDDSVFPSVTATTQIDASGGHGKVSMLEVPIGVNHLMTAIATWPDGATDTIKCIIPEIREGELTRGTADYRTTVIADAAVALAAREGVILSRVSQDKIDNLTAAVDAFHNSGCDYRNINIQDVLDYENTGSVVSIIDVSPATTTVAVGATAQFTATPKNTYGMAVTATATMAITWSVTGGVGTIDSSGLFTAITEGVGTVAATSGTISGSAQVTVVNGPYCGDGNTDTVNSETCDDGNTVTETCTYGQTSCDVCNATCQTASGTVSFCGDSTTDTGNGETCDDGSNNGQPNYCNTTCDGMTGSVCGNSLVESGETCDDGNTVTETCTYGQTSCDVCNATCQTASGTVSFCGDSTTDTGSGETCDDGNTTGGDGCSATCQNDAKDTNAWLTISAGDFVMGCAAADTDCNNNESPKHTVTISEYKIQKYEVTNAQYKACVDAGTCTAPSDTSSYTHSSYYGNATYDNYPVIYVSWTQASTYCGWIGGRMPTEAEWEKAARGPSPSENIYPWGDTAPTSSLANLDYNVGDTTEVGSYASGASYYGVMDMAGNVWEWVNDWYDVSYYSSSPSTDPPGPTSGTYRVLRGGSWDVNSGNLRASNRNNHNPTLAYNVIGFRCAQDYGVSGPVCGNGTTEQGETCDDGSNNGQPNYCNATCDGTTTSVCGNSVTESGETCDDGNTVTETCTYGQTSCDVCNATCQTASGTVSFCGYSTTDTSNGETCDDGNTTGGDGCSATCQNDAKDTNAWLTISAGDFVMGCAAADTDCYSEESPKHTVTLSEYKIQKYEVTNAQYKACVDTGTCSAPSSSASYTHSSYYGNATYDNYPVIYVDWNKASTYCGWIGGRLPTEAEWEKAARGPSPSENIYSWADTAPTCSLANFKNGSYCVGDTTEVGSYSSGASYYGAMDMAGNVWEWVNDWYSSSYYSSSPTTDPTGPTSGTYRVLRGGSWGDYPRRVRASNRYGYYPTYSYLQNGFRCAQD